MAIVRQPAENIATENRPRQERLQPVFVEIKTNPSGTLLYRNTKISAAAFYYRWLGPKLTSCLQSLYR